MFSCFLKKEVKQLKMFKLTSDLCVCCFFELKNTEKSFAGAATSSSLARGLCFLVQRSRTIEKCCVRFKKVCINAEMLCVILICACDPELTRYTCTIVLSFRGVCVFHVSSGSDSFCSSQAFASGREETV